MAKALTLLSGGLDSTAAMLMALDQFEFLSAITIDYGQKAATQEIKASQNICQKMNVDHKVVSLPFFSELDHPFFNNENKAPNPGASNLDDLQTCTQTAKAVWVPNRNGLFINLAASLAEAQNIDHIIVGFNKEEAATFPDNSKDFMNTITKSLSYSTLNQVKVVSPTVDLTKKEIVNELKKINFNFDLLWSCYSDGTEMCGECESCLRLRRALA